MKAVIIAYKAFIRCALGIPENIHASCEQSIAIIASQRNRLIEVNEMLVAQRDQARHELAASQRFVKALSAALADRDRHHRADAAGRVVQTYTDRPVGVDRGQRGFGDHTKD